MLSTRQGLKIFKAADWRSQEEIQQFVANVGQLAASDVAKYLSLVIDETLGASASQHAKRLVAFQTMAAPCRDARLFAVYVKALNKGNDKALEVLVDLAVRVNNATQHGLLRDALSSTRKLTRAAAAKVLASVATKGTFEEALTWVTQAGFAGRIEALDAMVPRLGYRSVPMLAAVVEAGDIREQAYALGYLIKPEVHQRDRHGAFDAAALALEATDIRVLALCLKALAAMGLEDRFFETVGPLLVSKEQDVVRQVLQAVSHFKSPRTIELLRRKLNQGPNQVRLTVLEVLERIGSDDVIPILADALSSKHVTVRSKAAQMLSSLASSGRADIARSLIWLLRSRDENVRRMAAEIANSVKDPTGELGPRLLTYLTDEDWWVRERVTDALAKMWSTGLARHMVGFLNDESEIVRRFAIGGLRRVKDPETLGALVRAAMSDENWWVRETAVETIAELKDPRAIPYLIDMMQKQPDMRICVVTALSNMHATETAGSVAELLSDDDADVRYAAIHCLEKLADRSQGLWVKPCEDDPDLRVRHAARHLLAKWTVTQDDSEEAVVIVEGDNPIDRLLAKVVEAGADDLIVATGRVAYMKKLGQVHPLTSETLRVEEIEHLIYEHLSLRQREALEGGKDVDFSYESKLAQMRFRVNVFQQMCGLSAVFRTIKDEIADIESLGLPPHVRNLADLRNGLVLIGGPTGSGKSTTLAALVNDMNATSNRHIITIEDPIEVVHHSKQCLINQREVGAHAPSFKTALRSVLREDPDVILIGEMRDLETISFAVTAAETGHLVFGTVHTVSADKCVDRMINAFPAPQQPQIRGMLSETLRAVVCQHLLRRKEGSGRVLAVEVMLGNEAIKTLIRKGKAYQIASVIATHTDRGMQLMDHELARLVKEDVIEYGEAQMRSTDKADFERRVGDRGIEGDQAQQSHPPMSVPPVSHPPVSHPPMSIPPVSIPPVSIPPGSSSSPPGDSRPPHGQPSPSTPGPRSQAPPVSSPRRSEPGERQA